MDKCCGGGCGEVYSGKSQDMRLTLDLIKESGILTISELKELHEAVDAYEEKFGEK